ncbi:YdcF family protein [Mucilaginibacter sp.]|jgi:uncharacterized SAM-binding protein YcdF (DUF218 family)|uniref:YdcF family protein n=1 Tax=Mucilaginibacter sp. TaxID=1882438 RepID=UPI002C5C2B6A|nr:YdcF family protein [Mucilaginibacter sp.]HTI57831.1 YdcF family protein [Mucilaginibacter sp.]
MYIFFSNLAVLFISPFNWIVALLLVAVLTKNQKWKKRSLVSAVVILFLFSNMFLLNTYARWWDVSPAPLEKGKVYSAAIILGGFTSEDNKGKGFFNERSDRLIEGMHLMATGRVSHIMMSGGNRDAPAAQFTEGAWVYKTLKEFNFPDSALLVEHRSINTTENAEYTRQVLQQGHLKGPYLLVTSAFHMRRALYIFRKKGVDVLPYPCDYVAGNTNTATLDNFIPNLYALSTWNFYIKELLGMVVAHVQR